MNVPQQDFRLSHRGLLNRSDARSFWFGGRHFTGYQGDTLASALLAHGVHEIGTALRSGRPRGIAGLDADDRAARIQLGEGSRIDPRALATQVEVTEGMVAHPGQAPGMLCRAGAGAMRRMPSALAQALPCPGALMALPMASAGCARDPVAAHLSCDLLVVGAGPAGLWSALTAARAGARVVLIDRDHQLGGRALAEAEAIDDVPAPYWVRDVLTELDSFAALRVLLRATLIARAGPGRMLVQERLRADHPDSEDPDCPTHRLWSVAAQRTVLATGARERPILFPGNDRPGIMAASAMRGYLHRYGVAPGRAVTVLCNNDDGHRTAQDLTDAGVEVTAVIDLRPGVLRPAPFPVLSGADIVATEGRGRLSAVTLRRPEGTRRIATDALAVAGGYAPRLGPLWQAEPGPVWDAGRLAHLAPTDALPDVVPVGAAAGAESTASCLADADAKTRDLLDALGHLAPPSDLPAANGDAPGGAALWLVEAPGRILVDAAADVTLAELQAGRSDLAPGLDDEGLQALPPGLRPDPSMTIGGAALTGLTLGGLAALTPAPLLRESPVLVAARSVGARIIDRADWAEIADFGDPGGELTRLQDSVGVCDLSSDMRVELQGPDVEMFFDTLAPGVAVPATGAAHPVVLAPGMRVLAARLSPDRVWLGRAEDPSALWEVLAGGAGDLRVALTDVTDTRSHISLVGPRAAVLLRWLVQADRDPAAMPPGSVWSVSLHGLTGWIIRPTEGAAFRLETPARYGAALWRDLIARAEGEGGGPAGRTALAALRLMTGRAPDSGWPNAPTQIVCVRPVGAVSPPAPGAMLIPEGTAPRAENALGHVLDHADLPGHPPMARARLRGGASRAGQVLCAVDPLRGTDVQVRVQDPGSPITEDGDA